MPKTNTQNPNEQNRNTNTPNGANYTNPLQNEFENSATYRVIHKVGDKFFDVPNVDGLPKLKIANFYRAAMGSGFRLPFAQAESLPNALTALKARGFTFSQSPG